MWSRDTTDAILDWLARAGAALAEVAVVAVFGLLPLAVAVLRIAMNEPPDDFTAAVATERMIGQGQLFLYAFSVIGTLVWLSIVDFRAPHTRFRALIAVVVVLLAIGITGTGIFDPSFIVPEQHWTVDASVGAYIVSLVLYFLLVLIRKSPPPQLSKTLDDSTNALMGRARGILVHDNEQS